MVLRKTGAWDIVNGTITRPAGSTRDAKAWDDFAADALVTIGLCVEPSQYQYIQDAADGTAAWDSLKKKYEKNSRANRIALKRQFYGFKHDPDQPIHVYIAGITGTARKLKAIGVKIKDTDVMDVLILNLAPSWSSIAGTLSTTLDDLASIDDVTGALIDEEGRRGDEQTSSISVAMMARQPTCWNCGKVGHKKWKCPEPRKEKDSTEKSNLSVLSDAQY
ncbi:hypothetical protein EXIGLDRAFT_611044 [Exidia glandulosa HHB12029]|uniref:CCHC-type domain-containing protein n=1 Tax=Exidia glandulosa HHB12029 TaxID=1314781 RepID=A0A165JN43_EXIGL|nr:hypothetical protein EXIGLDRAFT_611044 [Exidia glandulosa HHB12029]